MQPEAPEARASAEPRRASKVDAPIAAGPVVLFDGVCNLCNGTVQLILDHERTPSLRFAALQSDVAKELLAQAFDAEEVTRLVRGSNGEGDPDSVVLIEGGRGYTRSTAALRILRHLRAPYRWLSVLVVVPRAVRDAVYRWIGRNRYRWFGKAEACRVPTPELRARFLA